MGPNEPMQPRFKLRHAVVGYIVALAFAFNGLLTGVIDAGAASGGASFALITCLSGQVQGQVSEQVPGQPGQSNHAGKCSCTLSCCCEGSLARNSDAIDVAYPAAGAAVSQHGPYLIEHDFRSDRPLHLRSPPAISV
jgi:hypothetical protein